MLDKMKIWFTDHVAKCDRVELEQSLIRLGIGLAILVYLLYRYFEYATLSQHDIIAFRILGGFLFLTLVLIGSILLSGKPSVSRRLIGAWVDQGKYNFVYGAYWRGSRCHDRRCLFMGGFWQWISFR